MVLISMACIKSKLDNHRHAFQTESRLLTIFFNIKFDASGSLGGVMIPLSLSVQEYHVGNGYICQKENH